MSRPKIKLSILVSSRKNSKYLAKFLATLSRSLVLPELVEVRVMTNADDTWNSDILLLNYPFKVFTYRENSGLGRHGLHEYFNTMAQDAVGDWIIYFCDDHHPYLTGWDSELYRYINGGEDKPSLDPKLPHVIVPKWDNAGAMNHVVSRGYFKLLGSLGRHGNIDSYINEVNRFTPRKRMFHLIDEEWFHDFTHDEVDPMSPAHSHVPLNELGKQVAREQVDDNLVKEDALKVERKWDAVPE